MFHVGWKVHVCGVEGWTMPSSTMDQPIDQPCSTGSKHISCVACHKATRSYMKLLGTPGIATNGARTLRTGILAFYY